MEKGLGSRIGRMEREQIVVHPSGELINIGLSWQHSDAQHDRHHIPSGVRDKLLSDLLTLGSVQSSGREGSAVGREQV